MRCFVIIAFVSLGVNTKSQTLGGNAVFNFLVQPNTAQLSALGGVNVSAIGNDVGMAFHNPSLLRRVMHGQVNTSFNGFLAGIKNYSATGAYHAAPYTTVALSTNYFDYGMLAHTDASGNILGSFRPVDYMVQAMASRQYKERFWYGLTAKYIHSGYGAYRSTGLAFDVGICYYDSSRQLQLSIVAKNMGTQLKTYDATRRKEELPFDLQAGITKRLANAPIQFSFTAHHLHRFNIYYSDSSFSALEGETGYGGRQTLQKIFSHIVFSAQFFLNEKIELMTGYHFQRRQDLNAFNFTSGLNGFTVGTAVYLDKLHIKYATGFYQRNLFHQFSLNLNWAGKW